MLMSTEEVFIPENQPTSMQARDDINDSMFSNRLDVSLSMPVAQRTMINPSRDWDSASHDDVAGQTPED